MPPVRPQRAVPALVVTALLSSACPIPWVGTDMVVAQARDAAVAQHVDAARTAAGENHGALFNLICPLPDGEAARMPAAPAGLPSIPGEEPWRTSPVEVFDNLHYVGQSEYSAWAVETPEGILVIDALFDYSAEAQIADGIRELGMDPADIRYVIVSHGHGDHVGGAAHLQEAYGARIVLSEADWDLVEASTADWPKPDRDIVATDGQVIELGDVTVTLYLTPGHTPGTLSTVINPVRDGDRSHVAAAWGGTAFNFRGSAEFPRDYWLNAYAESAVRFREVVHEVGADILIANHPRFDSTPLKVPALAERATGDAHPYVIGTEGVARYLDVAEHCARAAEVAER